MASSEEERELFYRFAATVILADDKATELEKAWLGRLAEALKLTEARRRAVEGEVFG
jgi:uncharacterized membrane protein YebE (DUF533 family)